MAIIKPFAALRPQKELAANLASRPYDVLNRTEAKEEVRDHPYSFLHITRAEVDLPNEVDIYNTAVYEKAKENLQKFREKGILFTGDQPCYYIYRLSMNNRSQTGLACISSVDDYLSNVIKKHELTRPDKEKDRIDHISTVRAQTGKVLLAYNNIIEIDGIINTWKKNHAPEYDFITNDGVQHTIWIVNDSNVIQSITMLFADKVPATYIADGHHRAASAAKVSEAFPDNEAAKYFLTVIFPASELTILDYNRLVKDLNGLSTEDFISELQEDFEITESLNAVIPDTQHEFGMYLDEKWYLLRSRPDTYTTDPIGALDVTILTNNILEKLLGITDQRTDKRIDFAGGIAGPEELEKRVNSGEMKVAFSLYPVTIQQLFDIADSGEVMPPKSTWFEPKLRDGLLTHLI